MASKDKVSDIHLQEVGDQGEIEVGLQSVSAEAAALTPVSEVSAKADSPAAHAASAPVPQVVEKSCSRGLAAWLASNNLSLAISSYQTGRVYLDGSDKLGRVSFFER